MSIQKASNALEKRMSALDQVMGALDGIENNTAEGNGQMMVQQAGETTVETAPVLDGEGSKADPRFVHVPLDEGGLLLAALRTAAGEGTALGPFVQQLLAEKYNVQLPQRTDKRIKYTTEAERQAARERSITKAGNLRKALMAAHKAKIKGDAVALAKAEADIALWS